MYLCSVSLLLGRQYLRQWPDEVTCVSDKSVVVACHITAVIPNRFQASWDDEVVMVCASVVIAREKRESTVGDNMVGRLCNILRMLLTLFFGARIEKGCARGRMTASATLRRKA